jgi:Spy/CpxP family protein refolding chaperone
MSDAPGVWRGRIAVALLLLMVFGAGMITGAWAHRLRMRRTHAAMDDRRPPFGADRDRHFGEELDLDPVQRARVDSVFARRRVQIDSFWKGPGRSLRAIMDSTRDEVRAVLTPEQRAKFDRRRMEGRPRHPGDAGPPMPPPPR